MEEKLRIYLDTNVIIGWFKRRIIEGKSGIIFVMPERLQKLIESQHELFVSLLVKAEVSRYLKSEWQMSSLEILKRWEQFVDEMKIKVIELESFEVNLKELDQICSEVPLKKKGTFADLIHLQISKIFNFKFLTSETKLKKKLVKFYDNIIQISEFS